MLESKAQAPSHADPCLSFLFCEAELMVPSLSASRGVRDPHHIGEIFCELRGRDEAPALMSQLLVAFHLENQRTHNQSPCSPPGPSHIGNQTVRARRDPPRCAECDPPVSQWTVGGQSRKGSPRAHSGVHPLRHSRVWGRLPPQVRQPLTHGTYILGRESSQTSEPAAGCSSEVMGCRPGPM